MTAVLSPSGTSISVCRFAPRLLRIVAPLILLILTLLSPTYSIAQETPSYLPADGDTIVFRFKPGRLMFWSPYGGNDKAIEAMHRSIAAHREEIRDGAMKVRVNGYCNSYRSRARNLAAAKNRSNQVKSWFITHDTLVEDNFVTSNHAYAWKGMGDVVAVSYLVRVDRVETPEGTVEVVTDTVAAVPVVTPPAEEPVEPIEEVAVIEAEPEAIPLPEDVETPEATAIPEPEAIALPKPDPRHVLALKTNLLYYCALLPNVELEWLINDRWSVALEGNLAWWGHYDHRTSYRLAVIGAEARRWINPKEPWHGMFAGVFGGGGWYDLENGGRGYYGEGGMAGASFGYMWPVKRNLSFEASIGAGYLYTRVKEYVPLDGHHVYVRTRGLSYFGPLKLKFSIVWRFLDRNSRKTPAPAI